MNNTVNGKPRTTDTGAMGAAGATELPLLDFLRAHDVNPRLVAVAINGDVIPKTSYDTAVVHEGDDLEIVRMVGGGSGDAPSSGSVGRSPARRSVHTASLSDERDL